MNTVQNALSNKLNYETVPQLQNYIAQQIGDYKMSARAEDINGWMVCDGRRLLRSEYPELFSVIGTDFGAEPDPYFCLPDYTSKVIGMFGPSLDEEESNLTTRTRGQVVGHETIQLTVDQLPPHSHTGTTDYAGAHTHTVDNIPYGVQTIVAAGGGGLSACDNEFHTISTNTSGSHVHTFTSTNTGRNDNIDVMQPTLFGSSVLIFTKFLSRYDLKSTPWVNRIIVG